MARLEISDLSHNFGGVQAVSDFALRLGEGEMVGLIGPNGAGKTTIFNLISGFYQPTAGTIRIGGKPTKGLKPHQVAALGVARTFQNIRLWNDMTVLENICVSQHYRLGYGLFDTLWRSRAFREREETIRSEARRLLDRLDLAPYAEALPKSLSYGTQRKVEIARALSMHPRLLLLDEPAAGLNSADIDKLVDLISWIHREFAVTILMIEHHMDVIMALCSRIKVIDFGREVTEGDPEHVRSHPAVIAAYLGDGEL